MAAFANNLFDDRSPTLRSTQAVRLTQDGLGIVDDGSPFFNVNPPRTFGIEIQAGY